MTTTDRPNRHARAETLTKRPKFLRTPPSKGFAENPMPKFAQAPRVDRTGGAMGAGLIRGASLCTRGEAQGHGLWLDAEFIASVNAAAAALGEKGVKARFTHPGLSGDGLGTFLGRFQAAGVTPDGRRALADLHLSEVSHRSPDGDLGGYVCDLADTDPDAFAVSIVFAPDFDAEVAFLLDHGATWEEDPEFGRYLCLDAFTSPDPENLDGLPHARLKQLRAADMVDTPAANPAGLFHREQDFATEASAVVAYALGLSQEEPECVALSIHPDRVKTFVEKFLADNGLEIRPRTQTPEKPMTTNANEGQPDPANAPAPTTAPETPEGQPDPANAPAPTPPTPPTPEPTPEPTSEPAPTPAPEPTPTPSPENLLDPRLEVKRFIDAFGPANGGVWYAEGISFADAHARHLKALAEENAALKRRLAAAGLEVGGETAPVTFQPEGEKPGRGAANKPVGSNLAAGLQRFAEGIKLPEDGKKKRNQ